MELVKKTLGVVGRPQGGLKSSSFVGNYSKTQLLKNFQNLYPVSGTQRFSGALQKSGYGIQSSLVRDKSRTGFGCSYYPNNRRAAAPFWLD